MFELTVMGKRDYSDDGDKPFSVQIDSCKSNDTRYDQIRSTSYPRVTMLQFVNKHIDLPLIEELRPQAAHVSGTMVTVIGRHFGDAVVYFAGYTLGGSAKLAASRRRSAVGSKTWMWVFNKAFAVWQPILQGNLELMRNTTDVARNTTNIAELVLDAPSYNMTLCMAMRAEGMLQDNITANRSSDGIPSLSAGFDPRLSELLQFRRVSSMEIVFRTPCLNHKPQTYQTVMIVQPVIVDGTVDLRRRSAIPTDVTDGAVTREQQYAAELYVTDKCLDVKTVLLNGECRPCTLARSINGTQNSVSSILYRMLR